MENKRVSEKLQEGYYKTTLPFKNRKQDLAVNTAYRADIARLEGQFKVDALVELKLLKVDSKGNQKYKHPKADLLWEKAWDRGHSNGLSEIWFDLQDLSELLSEVE